MQFDEQAVQMAERSLCEDAFALFKLAYDVHNNNCISLPSPPTTGMQVSGITIISLEGINGSGKTTQISRLTQELMQYNPLVPPRFYDCVPARIIRNESRGNFYSHGLK